MGELDAKNDAILDRALVETYRQKGITTDPVTQKKEPPLMEDLYKVLLGMEDQNASDLALRFYGLIEQPFRRIFAPPAQDSKCGRYRDQDRYERQHRPFHGVFASRCLALSNKNCETHMMTNESMNTVAIMDAKVTTRLISGNVLSAKGVDTLFNSVTGR